ncbi:dihydroxyacetone kinase subunit DhaL [Rubrimonas sp.]|uniref:dihydroxyacetone kinase subunit DhaL n=1 Tax=Rubrimonas sp. TaxID=2036015 RepID=UPI002FDD3B0B
MSGIDAAALAAMFARIADRMEAEKGRLCELDGVIGDADHGIAMALGFAAARDAAAVAASEGQPADVLAAAGKAFLNAVGASSGPLYATAMLEAAKTVKGAAMLGVDQAIGLVSAFAAGIERRGKAARGDKTMLDAWGPAADAADAARANGDSIAAAYERVAAAAEAGAATTVAMPARLGRAARLGDRSIGHMDPGAASAVVMLRAMGESFRGA